MRQNFGNLAQFWMNGRSIALAAASRQGKRLEPSSHLHLNSYTLVVRFGQVNYARYLPCTMHRYSLNLVGCFIFFSKAISQCDSNKEMD